MTDDTLTLIDGRPSLRFERRLPHGVERVWRAVSEPAELAQWFPAAADWTPAVGETFEAGGMRGEVTLVEPPHRLEWTFEGELYRFELTGDGADGTLLVFTHRSHDPALAAQTATGWHTYLLRLEPLLDGGFLSEEDAHADWGAAHERYAERFGVDPTPGREFAAALRGEPR